MIALLGVLLLVVATALFAFAGQAGKSTNPPAFTSHYSWVAVIPLAVTCLLVVGIALCWKYGASLGGTPGVLVGVGSVVLTAVLFRVFWRLFAPRRPALPSHASPAA